MIYMFQSLSILYVYTKVILYDIFSTSTSYELTVSKERSEFITSKVIA